MLQLRYNECAKLTEQNGTSSPFFFLLLYLYHARRIEVMILIVTDLSVNCVLMRGDINGNNIINLVGVFMVGVSVGGVVSKEYL